MKNRIALLIVGVIISVVLIISATRVYSQSPQIMFQQPIASQANTWSMTLSDPNGKPVSVILNVSIEFEKQGSVMTFTTQKISFQSSLQLSWKDLTEKYIRSSSIQPEFKDGFYGYSDLPMGYYQICYSLMSEEGASLTDDCHSFTVESIGILPPILIEPSHGDTIRQAYPMFTWSPPAPLGENAVSYELFLFEISQGQSPEGAVAKNQPHHSAKGINGPFYNYPADALALKIGQSYAWQIFAYVDKEILPSNIEHFVFGNDNKPDQGETLEEEEGVMYFQLSKQETNSFYHLGTAQLYFIYVNENTSKALTYSLLNAAGEVVSEGALTAKYGYNLFSLDLSAVSLEKNSICQLLISKDQEPEQQLHFLFNPEN